MEIRRGGRRSRPISRVLSRAAIHLGRMSPCASSDLPGNTRGPRVAAKAARSPIWSCSGWGLPCRRCCHQRGALLPHHFTLTSRTSRRGAAVSFLWHFPWTCAPQVLPGTLPVGARTFLPFHTGKERLPGRLPTDDSTGSHHGCPFEKIARNTRSQVDQPDERPNPRSSPKA